MIPPVTRTDPPMLALGDIYHVLFRRKYPLLACSFSGLALGLGLYLANPPPYQSEAKLFIRYVAEAKDPAPAGTVATAKSPDQRGETILDSEMEIITSWDLARQVAETVGPAALLGRPAGNGDLVAAAKVVKAQLLVEAPPRSSVIRLVFTHRDPAVAQRVLRETIDRYLRLHLEVHSTTGTAGNFLSAETGQLRARLARTDGELRKLRTEAGVFSLEDSRKADVDQLAALRQQIFATQAELAEHTAVMRELQQQSDGPTPARSEPPAPVSPALVQEHLAGTYRLGVLRRLEQDLLTQFRAENNRVQEVRRQIGEVESRLRALENDSPGIALAAGPAQPVPAEVRPVTGENALQAASIRVTALTSKLQALHAQSDELRAEAGRLESLDASIADLRRSKDLDEANYRYYAASLEQARIGEALGAGHVPNISEIQKPSPPSREHSTALRVFGLLGGGGIVLGFAWAFVSELYLDRTVKRPVEIERLLHPALLLAVPAVDTLSRGPAGRAPGFPPAQELVPFHETLRDRLIGYFEGQGLQHKPKLVGVTGLGNGSGISTTAAGLARSLSEIGEGTVLLVDLTIGQESARHFVRGQPVLDVDQVLAGAAPAEVETNLFVAGDNSNCTRLSRNLPQRFSRLAPKLKASDFDYIVFDLPALSTVSITPRIAGYLDMLFLVVRSESSGGAELQHAAGLLSHSKVPLGVVLNRTRSYVPAWLNGGLALDS